MNRGRARDIVVLVALSTVIIGWGIWRIPPHQLNGDELSAVGKALLMLFHEPVMPRFRKGGNFHLRLMAFAFLPLATYWLITGRLGTVIEGSRRYASENPLEPGTLLDAFYQSVLIGRSISVIASVGTVCLVYLIAERMADQRAARVAGLTTVASAGFVTLSKFATEDASMVFLMALVIYLLILAAESQRPDRLILAAAITGLAVSTKATSGVLLVPFAAAFYMVEWRPHRSPRHAVESVGLYGLAAFIAYFATTPSALFFPERWMLTVMAYTGLSLTTIPVSSGYTYPDPGWLVASAHLSQALGIMLFIVGVISVVAVARGVRTGRYDLLLIIPLACVAGYALFLTPPRMPQYPRLMPLLPFIAICVGVVTADLRGIRERWAMASAVVIVLVVMITMASTVVFTSGFAQTRADATEWSAENIETGSTVDVYSYRVYRPEFPDGVTVIHNQIADPTDIGARYDAITRVQYQCPDYIAVTSYYYGRFFRPPSPSPEATLLMDELLFEQRNYRPVAHFGN